MYKVHASPWRAWSGAPSPEPRTDQPGARRSPVSIRAPTARRPSGALPWLKIASAAKPLQRQHLLLSFFSARGPNVRFEKIVIGQGLQGGPAKPMDGLRDTAPMADTLLRWSAVCRELTWRSERAKWLLGMPAPLPAAAAAAAAAPLAPLARQGRFSGPSPLSSTWF